MDGEIALLIAIAAVVGAGGSVYRRYRSKSLGRLSDEEFVRAFYARYSASLGTEAILTERRYIAKALGLAAERLGPEQNIKMLSERLSYLADFSVAWNDLADEAAEVREANGLPARDQPPMTIGEIIEDRLIEGRSLSRTLP